MTELQALLMGLLQGLTEYLPISSSGHLTIAGSLFGIEGEENLTFTIAVHVATVLSTLVILWREISWLLKGLVDTKAPLLSPERRYIMAIIVSMIPIGIVGVADGTSFILYFNHSSKVIILITTFLFSAVYLFF